MFQLSQQLYCFKIIPIMSEDVRNDSQNFMPQFSERQSQNNNPPEQKQSEQINPEATIQTSVEQQMPLKKPDSKNSSKLLLKQKDRYENRTIQKGMFTTLDDSVDELKVIYTGSPTLKKQESTDSIKKRRPFKLAPIQNSSSIELITQSQLNKKSQIYEMSTKMPLRTIVAPLRAKQITNIHQFVKQSIPVNKKLVGILKRNRGGTKRFFPQYDLYLNQQLKFLMVSKRKPCHLTSNYHMGTSVEPVSEIDRQYVGTIKSNFSGSQFSVYDLSGGEHQMIATITYTNQLSCQSVPRQIQVYILSPFYKYSDLMGSDDNFGLNLKNLYDIGENKENKKVLRFVTKKPIYDERKQVWGLDFHGKALYSSVKNMILVDSEDQNKEVMILAKAGDDVFNIDICHPLSPRIAMAIASSSFDFKWVSQ